MIAHIKGALTYKSFDYAIIDVNGIGYQVFIPLTTFYQLPEVYQTVSLNTHTHVREDALKLYGFFTVKERDLFQLLIGISGVGPRLARNILSGISADEFYQAVVDGDTDRLHMIPGVGAKTAKRLAIELCDKVKDIWDEEPVESKKTKGVIKDVVSALLNLGYKPLAVEKVVDKLKDELGDEVKDEWNFEGTFKKALKIIAQKH